jgi:type II secretory pathway component PulK
MTSGDNKNCQIGRSQDGVALVSALLVLALVAILAVTYGQRQKLVVAAASHGLHFNQLQNNLLISERWAQFQLTQRSGLGSTRKSGLSLLEYSPVNFASGKVYGQLKSLSGRFNVNNLIFFGVDTLQQQTAFIRLCQAAGLGQQATARLLKRLKLLIPPVAKGKVHLFNWQELVVAGDLNASQIAALDAMFVTLPTVTRVDINYVSANVLANLLPFVSPAAAEQVLVQRSILPFSSIEEFYRLLEHLGIAIDQNVKQEIAAIMGVGSKYFQLDLYATLGDADSAMTSWFSMAETNEVIVYARTLGVKPTFTY